MKTHRISRVCPETCGTEAARQALIGSDHGGEGFDHLVSNGSHNPFVCSLGTASSLKHQGVSHMEVGADVSEPDVAPILVQGRAGRAASANSMTSRLRRSIE